MSDLGTWLEGLGLGQYATAFAEHKLSFDLLPELTEADLRELGVLALGDRKRLLQAIAALAPAGGASKLAAAGRAEPMAEPE
ncbi:MAG: SAM domain-containing protein, partial [Gammaproteobacteria bacterium]